MTDDAAKDDFHVSVVDPTPQLYRFVEADALNTFVRGHYLVYTTLEMAGLGI